MHEYSITQSIISILEDVIKKKNIRRIHNIHFLLGPSANIEPDSIRFYYDFLTKENPVLKDGKLFFKRSPYHYHCMACKKDFSTNFLQAQCVDCSSQIIRLTDAKEIQITSINT